MAKSALPIRHRILASSVVDLATGCWNWILRLDKDGYAQIKIGSHRDGTRRTARAARVAYREWRGDIPEGMQIDHACRNRKCVAPIHLRLVTPQENTLLGTGPSAVNAKKRACPKGHLLEASNLSKACLKRGERVCLTCSREQAKASERNRRIKFASRISAQRKARYQVAKALKLEGMV